VVIAAQHEVCTGLPIRRLRDVEPGPTHRTFTGLTITDLKAQKLVEGGGALNIPNGKKWNKAGDGRRGFCHDVLL
jgi:hypothetical protein